MNARHTAQLSLFEAGGAGGHPPPDWPKSKAAPWGSGADHDVDGMLFKVFDDLEEQEALEIALSALSEVQQLPKNKLSQLMRGRKLQEVDPWAVDMPVYVCARDKLDDGVIYIYLYEGHLVIDLPDCSLWDDRGLGWLTTYMECCKQNKANLTPCRGRNCGCTPC